MFRDMMDVACPKVRKLLSAVSFHLSAVYFYLHIFHYSDLTPSYLYQRSILPMWVFALLFFLLAAFTYYTIPVRLTLFGRRIAAFGMFFYLLYALTYLPFMAYTAVVVYITFAFVYFIEALAKS